MRRADRRGPLDAHQRRGRPRGRRQLGIPCFETPTGWKFFGNLLDAGRVTLCGEESFGTGSDHVREKDGLWAVLFWLKILAVRGARWSRSCASTGSASAATSTRATTTKRDAAVAMQILDDLRAALPGCPGSAGRRLTVSRADDFGYTDPVDGSSAAARGCACSSTTARASCSASPAPAPKAPPCASTWSASRADAARHGIETQAALQPLIDAAEALTGLRARSGRAAPTVIT